MLSLAVYHKPVTTQSGRSLHGTSFHVSVLLSYLAPERRSDPRQRSLASRL